MAHPLAGQPAPATVLTDIPALLKAYADVPDVSVPEQRVALRAELGLDQPLYVQFTRFFGDLLRGQLGHSVHTHELVTADLARRFPATCELAFFSMCIAVVVGVGAGVLAAVRRGGLLDYLCMIGATAGILP